MSQGERMYARRVARNSFEKGYRSARLTCRTQGLQTPLNPIRGRLLPVYVGARGDVGSSRTLSTNLATGPLGGGRRESSR